MWDMLDSARAALTFIEGKSYESFASERMLRSAVERELEKMGEAARRISETTRNDLPQIPWRSVMGLRNVLAHEYDEIRYEVVWNVCRKELPKLIAHLEALGVESPSAEE